MRLSTALVTSTIFAVPPRSPVGAMPRLPANRGPALKNAADAIKAIDFTQNFVRQLLAYARAGVAAGKDLKQVYTDTRAALDPVYGSFPIYEHCMPFDVSRAYDEAKGIKNPRIWTAERDMEMWNTIA